MIASRPSAFALLLAALLATALLAWTSSPALAQTPTGVRITNVNSASFTVSWPSTANADGHILVWKSPVGPATRADDVRGTSVSGTTHSADVGSLLPGVTYLVDVVTGGAVDNNGGQHYRATTGPELAPRPPLTIYGRAARAGGGSPAGILVYLVVVDGDGSGSPGSSAPLSSVILESDKGYWFANLNEARLPDLSAPFVSSNSDKVHIQLVGGPGQVVEATLPIADLTQQAAPLVVPAPPSAPAVTFTAIPIAAPATLPAPSATPANTPITATATPPTAAAPTVTSAAGAAAPAPPAAPTLAVSPLATAEPNPPATPTFTPATPAASVPAAGPVAGPASAPGEPGLRDAGDGMWQWAVVVLLLIGTLLMGLAALIALVAHYQSDKRMSTLGPNPSESRRGGRGT